MIKAEVIKDFTLAEFGKLKNIERKLSREEGKLFVGDTFECDEEMAEYLLGNNDKGETVIKIIEVKPIEENKKEESKPKKKTSKK